MNIAWLCVTVLGCFVMKTTDAVLTAWTSPVISTKDGSGNITAALAEDATTFPLLAATTANNYVIISQTPAGIFEIPTASSGQLAVVTGKTLDYETDTKHVLVVTADDSTTTGTATITIYISDANDPPVFLKSVYSACVVDKTNKSASVLTVSTTDADGTTGANVISAMTITAGDTNAAFAINNTGFITLAKAVDMAITAKYNLTVEATDSDSTTKHKGTTTVIVVVSEKCGGSDSGVGMLATSLLTLLVGLVTSLSSL